MVTTTTTTTTMTMANRRRVGDEEDEEVRQTAPGESVDSREDGHLVGGGEGDGEGGGSTSGGWTSDGSVTTMTTTMTTTTSVDPEVPTSGCPGGADVSKSSPHCAAVADGVLRLMAGGGGVAGLRSSSFSSSPRRLGRSSSSSNSNSNLMNFSTDIETSPGPWGAILPQVKQGAHAASLAVTRDGTVIMAWFSGEEGAAGVVIAVSRLAPGSARWTKPVTVSAARGRSNQNPVLWVDDNDKTVGGGGGGGGDEDSVEGRKGGGDETTTTVHLLHTSQLAGRGQGTSRVVYLSSRVSFFPNFFFFFENIYVYVYVSYWCCLVCCRLLLLSLSSRTIDRDVIPPLPYVEDGGATWSKPIVHPSFKEGAGAFLRGRPLRSFTVVGAKSQQKNRTTGGNAAGTRMETTTETTHTKTTTEWLLPMYYTPGTSETHYCALRRSTDRGVTWDNESLISRPGEWLAQPSVVRLPNGDLRAYMRDRRGKWVGTLSLHFQIYK